MTPDVFSTSPLLHALHRLFEILDVMCSLGAYIYPLYLMRSQWAIRISLHRDIGFLTGFLLLLPPFYHLNLGMKAYLVEDTMSLGLMLLAHRLWCTLRGELNMWAIHLFFAPLTILALKLHTPIFAAIFLWMHMFLAPTTNRELLVQGSGLIIIGAILYVWVERFTGVVLFSMVHGMSHLVLELLRDKVPSRLHRVYIWVILVPLDPPETDEANLV